VEDCELVPLLGLFQLGFGLGVCGLVDRIRSASSFFRLEGSSLDESAA